MRTLTATLTAAQIADRVKLDPLVKIALVSGTVSYTYERDRILKCDVPEGDDNQNAIFELHNKDGALTALDLKGYTGTISFGALTSAGEEYSALAPMVVVAQQLNSNKGWLSCTLTLAGIANQFSEDHASVTYQPDSTNTDTVKTIISAILNTLTGAGACYNHCTAYTVDYDLDDSLIGAYIPAEDFYIAKDEDRLTVLKRLLSFTKCVFRAEADGHIHIFLPKTSG